ncbi:MAG TPA: hypothetical protein DDW78_02255 [Treponema sp.]|nr:hypothetical protein [Treponema sp.]
MEPPQKSLASEAGSVVPPLGCGGDGVPGPLCLRPAGSGVRSSFKMMCIKYAKFFKIAKFFLFCNKTAFFLYFVGFEACEKKTFLFIVLGILQKSFIFF